MSISAQSALEQLESVLPKLIDQRRPDLPPEVRLALCALASLSFQALQLALLQGPERLKAIRLLWEAAGLVSTDPSDASTAAAATLLGQ
jgi:hypothetical protein